MSNPFHRSGQRIWISIVVSYVTGLVQRFVDDKPTNEVEKVTFKAIRDLFGLILRRLKLA